MIHISEFLSVSSFLFPFQKGITGIRFAEHQRCYIRTQTKELPTVTEMKAEDREMLVQYAFTLSYMPLLNCCSPAGDCHAYCQEITRAELKSSVCPSHPISPSLWLRNKQEFVVPVKLPESKPQTLCLFVANIKWGFAVNLEPTLIFNHLLQRLYPNSLKGEGLLKRSEQKVTH